MPEDYGQRGGGVRASESGGSEGVYVCMMWGGIEKVWEELGRAQTVGLGDLKRHR